MKKILPFVFLALIALVVMVSIGYVFKPIRDVIWPGDHGTNMDNQYTVMTVNVGNSNLQCYGYSWKLCKKDVEQRLARNLQKIKPDIIAIQEVLPPWQCENREETNPRKVCSSPQDTPQVRRLFGDDYSIVCDANYQYECIGVHVDVGEILNCPVGGLCNTARTVPEIHGCDPGFSISAATIALNNGAKFDLVHIHPASFSDQCRSQMFDQAFNGGEGISPIVQHENVLIMGDFNLDPWRSKDESSKVWQSIFEKGWMGREYRYHSGIVEKDPPHYTMRLSVVRRTLDVVVSNFAEGVCQVLGESPGTTRLDGGKGNDHRAVYGVLTLKP